MEAHKSSVSPLSTRLKAVTSGLLAGLRQAIPPAGGREVQSYPQGRAHSQKDEETETDQVGVLEKPSMRKPGQGRRQSLLILFFVTGIQEGQREAGFR